MSEENKTIELQDEQLMKVSGGAKNNEFDEATKLLKEAGDRAYAVVREDPFNTANKKTWEYINRAENETSLNQRSKYIKMALKCLDIHSKMRASDHSYIYERLIKSEELTNKCK